LIGLVVGMAFILEFINGIAATTRMSNRLPGMMLEGYGLITDYSLAMMYMLTMPTNMIASLLLGYATIGLFISKKKDLVRMTGLAGAFLAISSGFPLAFYSMFFGGQGFNFSMFILGPVVSILVGVIFMSSNLMNKMMGNTD